MPDAWYTFICTLCARAYFARIRVLGGERLPSAGPILYVGLHRNGAVDGFVYKSIFRRAIFLIAAQLQKNLFSRMFFTGIPVVRDKDSGDRGMNVAAVERCAELLAAGGGLVIFPEGTSSLGPKHFPFKSGAARIALDAWSRGIPVKVVPLGITYNAPTSFRSSVEVVVGKPLEEERVLQGERDRYLAEMKHFLTHALEGVGINVDSPEYFEELQILATMALPNRGSFRAMKLCEPGIPEPLRSSWNLLRAKMQARGFAESTAARPFTGVSPWLSLCAGLALAPFVGIGALLNFLPLAGAYWAGKKLSDAPNVITLWRILAGVPLFVFWFVLVFAALVVAGKAVWFLFFVVLTVIAWQAYALERQLLCAGWNGVRFHDLRRQYLEFRRAFLQELDKHESSAS
jgi:1-acyl-sn-glycerol-3-phosphate acyltransferase